MRSYSLVNPSSMNPVFYLLRSAQISMQMLSTDWTIYAVSSVLKQCQIVPHATYPAWTYQTAIQKTIPIYCTQTTYDYISSVCVDSCC